MSDSLDFFLSGRSLPAWVTGLAFISANLGAIEIVGMSANGAESTEQLSAWPGNELAGFDSSILSVIGLVFGLGFVLSFGDWTTNFVEVQRAMASKSMSAARRTPIIGAFPKMFIPFIVVIPGMIAAVIVPELSEYKQTQSADAGVDYNDAILLLMRDLMDYLQQLFSFFNAPLFATFILGMFWRRMTAAAGWTGLVAGTLSAVTVFVLSETGVLDLPGQGSAFLAAGAAFVVDIVVSVAVSLRTAPKPAPELVGLVYGLTPKENLRDPRDRDEAWYQRPGLMAGIALVLIIVLNVVFF